MNGNVWEEVLKQYEMLGVENIIPVSHIRIKPDIGVLLDDNGNFVGAAIITNERCSIPCVLKVFAKQKFDRTLTLLYNKE